VGGQSLLHEEETVYRTQKSMDLGKGSRTASLIVYQTKHVSKSAEENKKKEN